MDILREMVTQSILTRLLAQLFLFLCLVAALVVYVWETMHGQPVPASIEWLLGAGIGIASNVVGIAQGITLKFDKTTAPLPPPTVKPAAPPDVTP